jgi:hypothetical protein
MQDSSPQDESDEQSSIIRWIPFLPLAAGMMLLCIFLIWAEIL